MMLAFRSLLPIALFGAIALVACSSGGSGSSSETATFGSEPLQSVTSDSGAFDVEVRTSPGQPPSRGEVSVQLVVRDRASSAPHSGLKLEVTPWMPAMGHGASVTPTVTETSPGTYVVSNVDLFMAGQWELRTTIDGDVTDHVAPSFEIE